MVADNITKENLITGRAGELTHNANKLTFDLLEKIFGMGGPYRNVLKSFKIKIVDLDDSYLIRRENVVYTDVLKEQKILWGNYPYVFNIVNGAASLTFDFKKLNFKNTLNYFGKVLNDAQIVTNIDSYVVEARQSYKTISAEVINVFNEKKLGIDRFLSLYEKVIYVSYLFEFVDLYNTEKPQERYAIKYVKENDYLLNDQIIYVENVLKLPNGFYLDDYKDLSKELEKIKGLDFIPDIISPYTEIKGYSKLLCVEKELQCLKNNLRLKTNVLLYFLNLFLLNIAHHRGISHISDKKFTDFLN